MLDNCRQLGWCWFPDRGSPGLLEIRATLRGQVLLDTFIHEMLHASLGYETPEGRVRRVASEIARVLRRSGYRITP